MLPNFLIVGAAKAGTTSLYNYLNFNKEIFLSSPKEPKFITSQFLRFPFNGKGDDIVESHLIKDFTKYESLFKPINNERAIGEVSADNLYYYKNSITTIKKYICDPKIIIILRNPCDRAYSAYLHLVRDQREELDFEESLRNETERIADNYEFIWHYKSVGFYYKQVKAYLNNFSRVKVYLHKDLKNDALSLVQDIYRFLEVDDTFVPNVKLRYNVSGIPKNKLLHKLINTNNPLTSIIKSVIPKDKRKEIRQKIVLKNLSKPEMKLETREYLRNLYREDILKLQDLVSRDLSQWLK